MMAITVPNGEGDLHVLSLFLQGCLQSLRFNALPVCKSLQMHTTVNYNLIIHMTAEAWTRDLCLGSVTMFPM